MKPLSITSTGLVLWVQLFNNNIIECRKVRGLGIRNHVKNLHVAHDGIYCIMQVACPG